MTTTQRPAPDTSREAVERKVKSLRWRRSEFNADDREVLDAASALLALLDRAEAAERVANKAENALFNLETEISGAIGSNRFLDPPDGGSVTFAEQVTRMRQALETAEKRACFFEEAVAPLKSVAEKLEAAERSEQEALALADARCNEKAFVEEALAKAEKERDALREIEELHRRGPGSTWARIRDAEAALAVEREKNARLEDEDRAMATEKALLVKQLSGMKHERDAALASGAEEERLREALNQIVTLDKRGPYPTDSDVNAYMVDGPCGKIASAALAPRAGAHAMTTTASPAPTRAEFRCQITGNLCGTDTWEKDSPCSCGPCREWLSQQAISAPDTSREVVELIAFRLRVRCFDGAASTLLALLDRAEAADRLLSKLKNDNNTEMVQRLRRDFREQVERAEAAERRVAEYEANRAHWHDRAITAEAALAKAEKERDESRAENLRNREWARAAEASCLADRSALAAEREKVDEWKQKAESAAQMQRAVSAREHDYILKLNAARAEALEAAAKVAQGYLDQLGVPVTETQHQRAEAIAEVENDILALIPKEPTR